jgi:threonine dehydrogenase-like Zn-dependent dehydrogenase
VATMEANLDLPARHLRWELTGAGLDRLSLAERERPVAGPGELVVRIDACGICFSDIKILNQGGEHPRLQGRDLTREPVVMGHETAMTVLDVGEELRDRFAPGQRYLIQADVYFNGQGMAFGYRLPGGFSQYQVIGREILDGDEGCYLLPVSDRLSHAQAALCEPWACVEAAYRLQPRREPKAGGEALVILLDFEETNSLSDELELLRKRAGSLTHRWLRNRPESAADLEKLKEAHPDGFDDLLFYGVPNAALAQAAAALLKPGGVFGIQGRGSTGPVAIDIGSVHYRGHWYTGSPDGNVYEWKRTVELTPGGTAWFIGAGGPLGQMHLQRALSLAKPPRNIIVTQHGGPRLEDLRQRFAALAESRGVEFVLLDSRALSEGVYDAVRAQTGGLGCDDICVVIPNAQVAARAFELLAPGGGMDIFAGVGVGTTAEIDLGRVATHGVRLWGTSGSSVQDLRTILEKAERGELVTDRVVAAVGGIRAVKQGLEAVRDATFLGKTVIYPHCKDLDLVSVAELAERHPSIAERLEDGRYWTPEAEAELLRLYGE